jgi:parallel beta-helix repeat protein
MSPMPSPGRYRPPDGKGVSAERNDSMNRVTSPSRRQTRNRNRSLVRSISFESLETRTLMSAFSVTTTADSGLGSLRQAILDANSAGGSNTITFNIPGNGVATIAPQSPLAALSTSATLDATTMSSYAGTPLVELSGSNAGVGVTGLEFDGPNSRLSGLIIDNFDTTGVMLGSGASNSVVSNNVISGNGFYGLFISADHATVQSNFIGTDATGSVADPNIFGLYAQSAASVTIGGSPADRNVISGNFRQGITLDTSPNSIVSNNYIGTDPTGTFAVPNNGDAVDLLSSGSSFVTNNLLSANAGDAVYLQGTSFSTISNNLIGTDDTGTKSLDSLGNSLGNSGNGVDISTGALHNTLDHNTIANNSGNGVYISDFHGIALFATVTNNFIGTDITGTLAFPNTGNGIKTTSGGNSITGNVISANLANGIASDGGDIITSNFIGVDINGNALPNQTDGIFVTGDNDSITSNTIAFNQNNGVTIALGTGNSIRANSIFANAFVGIDLNADGITPNDSEGHVGANNLQNFPVIGAITRYASGALVSGTLDSAPSSTFTLEFFTSSTADPSGFGQGQLYAGSALVTTDSAGHGTFSTMITNLVAGQSVLSATATDSAGNTSEFALTAMIPATITQLATTTTLSSSLNPAPFGASVTFTASAAATSSTMNNTLTGTVTFMDGNTLLGSVSVDASGNAAFATSALTAGDHVITAVYSGDPSFATSTSASLTQTVSAPVVLPVDTATSLSSSSNPAVFGAPVTFTATVAGVSSSTHTLTGNVTLMDGSSVLGVAAVDDSGHATFTLSSLSIGGHSLTAVYSGDANFNASTSSSLSESISMVSTSTTLSSSTNPSLVGNAITFTATVAAGLPFAPISGTITFTDGATVLATVSLDSTGHASLTVSSLTVGAHPISASYSGDSTFTASASPALNQSILAIGTSTTLVSSANPSNAGSPVTFTAAVAPTSATHLALAGVVTFMDGATTLGSVTLDSTGHASFTTSALTSGSHSITATFTGSTNFTASASAPLAQTINAAVASAPVATTTKLTSSSRPCALDSAITFTAAVTHAASTFSLGGTVTFKDGSTILAVAAVDSTGHATFTTSTLAAGSHSITAVYSGDSHYAASTSSTLTQVVTPHTQHGKKTLLRRLYHSNTHLR